MDLPGCKSGTRRKFDVVSGASILIRGDGVPRFRKQSRDFQGQKNARQGWEIGTQAQGSRNRLDLAMGKPGPGGGARWGAALSEVGVNRAPAIVATWLRPFFGAILAKCVNRAV